MARLNQQSRNAPRCSLRRTRQNRCNCPTSPADHSYYCKLLWILEYAEVELKSAKFHREGFLLSRLERRVKEAANDLKNEECAICMEPFDARCKFDLPCDPRHVFHKKCLNMWSRFSRTCPLCKKTFLKRVLKKI